MTPRAKSKPAVTHSQVLRESVAYVMEATNDLNGRLPFVAVDIATDRNGKYRMVLGVEADLAVLDAILDHLRQYYSPVDFHAARLSDVKMAREEGWNGTMWNPERI